MLLLLSHSELNYSFKKEKKILVKRLLYIHSHAPLTLHHSYPHTYNTAVLKWAPEQHQLHPKNKSEMQMLRPYPRSSRWFMLLLKLENHCNSSCHIHAVLSPLFLHHHAHHCLHLAYSTPIKIQLKHYHHFQTWSLSWYTPTLLKYPSPQCLVNIIITALLTLLLQLLLSPNY